MVKVLICNTKKLSKDEIDKITVALSADALSRLEKKCDERLRSQSLCALTLLSELLGKEALARLKYGEGGRPYLDGADLDISISHTDALCACAASDSAQSTVGIDVESRAIPSDQRKKIARRFFSIDEQKILNESKDGGKTFLEIWTKKEALKKRLGTNIPFSQLDTTRPEEYGVEFITQALPCGTLAVCVKKGEECEIYSV